MSVVQCVRVPARDATIPSGHRRSLSSNSRTADVVAIRSGGAGAGRPMLLEREAPLEALLAGARRAAAGHGSIVLLEGEAGIGKTSLLREFTGRVDAGCRVLWGWCEALFTPRPLGPLQDMAQSLDPRVGDLLDQAAAPERLFPALLKALQEAAGTRVLVFEDVHWADNATLDLVKISRPPRSPAAHDAGAHLAQRRGRRGASVAARARRPAVGIGDPDHARAAVSRRRHGAGRADGALRRRALSHHRRQPLLRDRAAGEQRHGAGAGAQIDPRRRVVAAGAPHRRRARRAGGDEHRAGERRALADPDPARRRGRGAGRPLRRARPAAAGRTRRPGVPP